MYRHCIKRLLDILFSALLLLIMTPLFLFIIVLIHLDSKGSAFFSQKRFGKDRSYFQIYKFRTMRTDTPHDVPTNDLSGASSYITRVGGVLRKTSLDELPQLWNILKGDMSFIGPRPALWNQTDLMAYRDEYGASMIRPGLSGWAQVNGRDALGRDVQKKAQLDGEYAKNVSFGFDLMCLVKTVVNVFRQEDVAEGVEGSK